MSWPTVIKCPFRHRLETFSCFIFVLMSHQGDVRGNICSLQFVSGIKIRLRQGLELFMQLLSTKNILELYRVEFIPFKKKSLNLE